MTSFESVYVLLIVLAVISGLTILVVSIYFIKFNYKVIWKLDNYGYGEEQPLLLYTAWIYAWHRFNSVSSTLMLPFIKQPDYKRRINLWEAPVPMIYKKILFFMDIMFLLGILSIVIAGIMTFFLPN